MRQQMPSMRSFVTLLNVCDLGDGRGRLCLRPWTDVSTPRCDIDAAAPAHPQLPPVRIQVVLYTL